MATLVCTIETVAPKFAALPPDVQHELTRWMRHKSLSSEAEVEAQRSIEAQLAYSPLTATIAVLGLYDLERDTSVIYYVDTVPPVHEDASGVLYKVRSEAALLQDFWSGAPHYDTFVSFNGRHFLLPFLLHRSAFHSITPSVMLPMERNLMRQGSVQHVDLLDQLTFMGAVRRHTLYHYCQAYQLPLPATVEATASLLQEGNSAAAATKVYQTLEATTALYAFWKSYFAEPQTIFM